MSRMAGIVGVCVAILMLAGGVAPAAAQYDGNLARVAWWSVKDGSVEAFEAGLKAHNELHGAQNDPVPILTWVEISGPRAGQYGRGSFDHKWSDFDVPEEVQKADNEDSAKNLTPHIASAEVTIWAARADLSKPATGPGALSRIIEFQVRPGQTFAFEQAVGKVHAALSKHEDWPSYEWYELLDGGRIPTYVVVLQRDNWAGFAPGDKSLMDVLRGEYGDAAPEIFMAIGAATERQVNSMIEFRPDLSYLPETGEPEATE